MEDYDWIEVAYIFDGEPSKETFKLLFDMLPRNPGPEYDANEFSIKSGGQNGSSHIYSGSAEAIEALSTSEYCSVEISMDRYGLDIGFDKNGKGFPQFSTTPYLRLATTIYSFEDSDDESTHETIKQRRREFVETLSNAANILEPKWGFGRRGGLAIGKNETVEELADRLKPPLYEYNVFREETVEAIGRDQVLSAPAYYVEELDSGGVFMAVTEPPRQWGHDDQLYEEVADHLDLPPMTPERYH